MEVEIRTARLRMRRARPDDLDATHALVSDYEVVKQTATWPWPPERAFTATRCTPMDSAEGMSGPVFHGDRMVGLMGVNRGDLGYNFHPDVWGQGFATEMGRALVAHAFATYDWPALTACVFEDNPASGRVLVKLGFEDGEACVGPCAARGTPVPMRTFRLARP